MILTDLEKQVLINFINSEYMTGDLKAGTCIWSFSLADDKIFGKQLSGIISSLCKKGIFISFEDDDEDAVEITELGIQLIEDLNLIDKEN